MMRRPPFSSARSMLLPASMATFLIAVVLLGITVARFTAERQRVDALGVELHGLRSRVRMLSSQVDAERVLGSAARTSIEEQASEYVLRETVDTSRIVRVLTELGSFSSASPLSVTSVTFDGDDDAAWRTVTVRAAGDMAALDAYLAVLSFGGMLTVGDAMGTSADAFLLAVEREAPASLLSAQQFVLLSLGTYAQDPDAMETLLIRDMQESAASRLRVLALQSGLARVRQNLTPIAAKLRDARLFPFPYFRLSALSFEEGNILLTFDVPALRAEPEKKDEP